MEAIGEFIPDRASSLAGPAISSRPPRLTDLASAPATAGGAVDAALTLLRSWAPAAGAEAGLFGLRESADFAARVEELSRTVE